MNLTLIESDTDLLKAQSDPYRRMSANLYRTKSKDQYYHIHGSLEASTTLRMLGLKPFRPDLSDHRAIARHIGTRVQEYTVEQLEELNSQHKQAGVPALTYDQFKKTPHVSICFLTN